MKGKARQTEHGEGQETEGYFVGSGKLLGSLRRCLSPGSEKSTEKVDCMRLMLPAVVFWPSSVCCPLLVLGWCLQRAEWQRKEEVGKGRDRTGRKGT